MRIEKGYPRIDIVSIRGFFLPVQNRGMMKTSFKTAAVSFLLMALLCLPSMGHAGQKTVTDLIGRTVTLPDHPRRVVSLAPSISEIVFAMGQGHRLVGVTQFSDYPKEALELAKVGTYVHLDLEKIVALKPDLCIAVKDGNPKAVVEMLDTLGIAVYAADPRNLASVIETIVGVGGILGAREVAGRLADDMNRRIQRVKERVATAGRRPGVFFQIGISPIVSVGTHTYIHEIIETAGGKNLAAGPVAYPRFSSEQVLSLAPDVIIITSMARQVVFEQVKAWWEQWPSLPAVATGRIFLQESNLFDRPSPRLVDGLELLARLIHPDLFGATP